MIDWNDEGQVSEYHRQYYHIRRKRVIDSLGGKCVKCGSTENLHFDHIDPSKKSHNINKDLYPDSEELKKCQLLCYKCHMDKTVSEKPKFTHGTIYGFMRMKCECHLCENKKVEWNNARNIRRRDAKQS